MNMADMVYRVLEVQGKHNSNFFNCWFSTYEY